MSGGTAPIQSTVRDEPSPPMREAHKEAGEQVAKFYETYPALRGRAKCVRRVFVKTPVVAYEPKKAGETDPLLKASLERGLLYVNEFAAAGE